MFINTYDTIFAARQDTGQILLWLNGSINPTSTIPASLTFSVSLFVTSDKDIFVDNGCPNSRVDRWTVNQTKLPSPMFASARCSGLFVDINDDLYCSQEYRHQVIRKSLNSPPTTYEIVAGTGCQGSASNVLDCPYGIFVTTRLDLYVADCNNDRVQLFPSGQMTATTVAGSGSIGSISLWCPTSVTLDGDGYLFITDSKNHRIVGSGPYGFRCLVGCSGLGGSAADQLHLPYSFSFDSAGNIFVVDTNNSRIQKFTLTTALCGKCRGLIISMVH